MDSMGRKMYFLVRNKTLIPPISVYIGPYPLSPNPNSWKRDLEVGLSGLV